MGGNLKLERAFAKVREERIKEYKSLHADPTRQSAEIRSGMAFNIGLTTDEMCQKMSADLPGFRKIYNLAVDRCVDWNQAEEIYNRTLAVKEARTDRVNASHNSSFPKWMKPKEIFIQIHKRRVPPTKTELAERATRYKKWKDAYDAINTDLPQPPDQDANYFPPLP